MAQQVIPQNSTASLWDRIKSFYNLHKPEVNAVAALPLTGIVGSLAAEYLTPRSFNASSASNFDSAYKMAKSAGSKTFVFNNKTYNTNYKADPKLSIPQQKQQELSAYGITSDFARDKSLLINNLHKGINPSDSYSNPIPRVLYSGLTGKSLPGRDNNADFTKLANKTDQNRTNDLWNLYLGFPQKHNTVGISKYKPSQEAQQPYYFKVNDPQLWANPTNIQDYYTGGNSYGFDKKGNATSTNPELGTYTIGIGQDKKGQYTSYGDTWDIDPLGSGNHKFPQIGKPVPIYNRQYMPAPSFAKGGSISTNKKQTIFLNKTNPKDYSGNWSKLLGDSIVQPGTETSGTYLNKYLNPIYNKYKPYFQKYLDRPIFQGTKLTADDLAAPFAKFIVEHPQVNPDSLANLMLAQGHLETHLGLYGRKNQSAENNPFNIGEFDAKTMNTFQSPKAGVEAYLDTLGTKYLPRVAWDPNKLVKPNNYKDIEGHRYASNPNYERDLNHQITIIQSRQF